MPPPPPPPSIKLDPSALAPSVLLVDQQHRPERPAESRPVGARHRPGPPAGFRGVLPRRWAVERTFSWLGQSRRLSKEYEHLCETSEAMIYATMPRRLART